MRYHIAIDVFCWCNGRNAQEGTRVYILRFCTVIVRRLFAIWLAVRAKRFFAIIIAGCRVQSATTTAFQKTGEAAGTTSRAGIAELCAVGCFVTMDDFFLSGILFLLVVRTDSVTTDQDVTRLLFPSL